MTVVQLRAVAVTPSPFPLMSAASFDRPIAVRVPRVELASDVHDLLLPGGGRFELPHDISGGRLLEEGHLVQLRIRRDLREWVAFHHRCELGARAHDDPDVEIEALRDQPLDLGSDPRRGGRARQHDISALDVGAHVLEAGVLERLAKLRHGDPISPGEVHASQEDDQSCQDDSLSRR